MLFIFVAILPCNYLEFNANFLGIYVPKPISLVFIYPNEQSSVLYMVPSESKGLSSEKIKKPWKECFGAESHKPAKTWRKLGERAIGMWDSVSTYAMPKFVLCVCVLKFFTEV